MVSDRLEIYVKQAPISKVVVTQNSIDVIKGMKNPEIIRRFPIENQDILEKFISIPRYMNSIIEQEQETICINLSGYHLRDGSYVPTDDAYDKYDMEDYYNNHGYSVPCEDSSIYFKEYIDKQCTKLIIFGAKTINTHKVYILDIIRECPIEISFNSEDFKENIGTPNTVCTNFTLEFVKSDCAYIKFDTVQKYNNDAEKMWVKKINKKGNSIVSVNAKHGFIVTKENSN